MRGRFTFLRSALSDQSGVGAVELALVAPFLGLLLVGITDLARGFSQKNALEQAVHRALEKATVGSVQSDYTYLRHELADAAGVALDKTTLDAWLECDRVRQPDFEGACPEDQMTSRYISLSVEARFDPVFGFGAFGLRIFNVGADGTMPLAADGSLRVQ